MNELREKIAQLAKELKATVSYDLSLTADSPCSTWPNFTERHRLNVNHYKAVVCMSLGQVMGLTKEDFVSNAPVEANI